MADLLILPASGRYEMPPVRVYGKHLAAGPSVQAVTAGLRQRNCPESVSKQSQPLPQRCVSGCSAHCSSHRGCQQAGGASCWRSRGGQHWLPGRASEVRRRAQTWSRLRTPLALLTPPCRLRLTGSSSTASLDPLHILGAGQPRWPDTRPLRERTANDHCPNL